MGQAVAKGEGAFRRMRHIILAQVGNGVGQRPVEVEPALLRQLQDHGGGGDHLRHRGEVEPMVAGQRFALRHDGRRSGEADRGPALGGDDTKRRAGNAAARHSLRRGREGGVAHLINHGRRPLLAGRA